MQELNKNAHDFESLIKSAGTLKRFSLIIPLDIDIKKVASAQYVIYKDEEINIDFRICVFFLFNL